MKKEKSSAVTALTILVAVASSFNLLVLKLCGVIAWSWWWVFSPLWCIFALVLLALGFLGLCLMILSYIAKRRK